MTTLTKTLLAASVVGFAIGGVVDFTDIKVDSRLTAALPLGAVFFELGLIAYMLEKPMAEFDAENATTNPMVEVKEAPFKGVARAS